MARRGWLIIETALWVGAAIGCVVAGAIFILVFILTSRR